jgi:hypothetical protein
MTSVFARDPQNTLVIVVIRRELPRTSGAGSLNLGILAAHS